MLIRKIPVLFFSGLVGYYMTSGDRGSSLSLCVRGGLGGDTNNCLREKEGLLDCLRALEGHKRKRGKWFVVF
jgi:hypothetical protein